MRKLTDTEILQNKFPSCSWSLPIFRLKYQLLAYGLVKPNKYLDLYLDLISINLKSQKVQFETQQHHCIPLGLYCKAFRPELNSSKAELRKLSEILVPDNLVINLKFKDHLLAHWYLYKCSKHRKFKQDNFLACSMAINNFNTKKLSCWLRRSKVAKFMADPKNLDQIQLNYTITIQHRGAKIAASRKKAK